MARPVEAGSGPSAPIRLVEGPFCEICGGGLIIVEMKVSDGGKISHLHRDGQYLDADHKARPRYRVLRP